MRSEAATVEEYLADLPPERREAIARVREVILANLPAGLQETMNWGMIAYEVPLDRYAETYNGKPLMYAALASQKNHMAVYLTGIYMDDEARQRFEDAYRATGKRIDVGQSCVRFRKIDDLPLSLIGDTVGSLAVDAFIDRYEEARKARGSKKG